MRRERGGIGPQAVPPTALLPHTLGACKNRPLARILDHAFKGEWADYRECHIGGDFLLIYQLHNQGNNEMLSFVRAGSHAELFES